MTWIEKWGRHLPWLMALLTAILYQTTLAPGVSHTDAGELSAVAMTFGVAHPTGYPLFTLLGWLFTRIQFTSIAWQLNFMCMLFVAASAYVWASFLRRYFIQMKTTVKKSDSSSGFRIQMANFSAMILGTLMLVLGRTWWLQSTSTEVYSLQCLLFTLMLHTLHTAWYAKENVNRAWGIFAVVLALCFTNHLTSIVVLPGVLYLFYARFGFKKEGLKLGLGLVGVGLVVLVGFYGMLYTIAQTHPAYNWGNAETWPKLWHHMTGKQFSVWMFNGPKPFGENLIDYLVRLPGEFGWDRTWAKIPGWALLGLMAFQGMTYTFQRRREWAIFFGIGFGMNIFWAANYSIKDPEPYFSFAYMILVFLGAMVMRWAWIESKKLAPYITGVFGAVIILMAVLNYGNVNQRKVFQFEDYARAALESLPENALVLSANWDVFIGPAYYLQACEGLRKDVTIVGYNMLHDRHWYPMQLRIQAPKLAADLGKRLDDWEVAVTDFDINGKVNPAVLGPRFNAVYMGILAQMTKRPVYLTPDVFQKIANREIPSPPKEVVPFPERYLVHLMLQNDTQSYIPLTSKDAQIRFGGDPEEYETKLLNTQLFEAWSLRATYEQNFGKVEEAQFFKNKIAQLGPRLN